uniref:ShKT domain-containing protein n=1 Tax=Timspurckia oligopyrenoides TaxID=708627 RepID=A0A7S1EV80_9RHOD|mmetsp:Transcript_9892/g.17828  ORF Transcript_9892/g.17828 Transcript_9892/m.17828 type:complete len:155 (+) Transcript_9892:45-509(+)
MACTGRMLLLLCVAMTGCAGANRALVTEGRIEADGTVSVVMDMQNLHAQLDRIESKLESLLQAKEEVADDAKRSEVSQTHWCRYVVDNKRYYCKIGDVTWDDAKKICPNKCGAVSSEPDDSSATGPKDYPDKVCSSTSNAATLVMKNKCQSDGR